MALLEKARVDIGDPGRAADTMVAAMAEVIENTTDPVLKTRLQRIAGGETPRQILGITHDEAEALYAHGYNKLKHGDIDGAAVVFDKLIELDPIEAKYFYVRGVCHHQKGDLVKAVRLYGHFLSLKATSPDGWLRMAECHLATGERVRAREMYETARDFADEQGDAGASELARAQIARLETEAPQ